MTGLPLRENCEAIPRTVQAFLVLRALPFLSGPHKVSDVRGRHAAAIRQRSPLYQSNERLML